MSTSGERSVKLPAFSGKDKDYQSWWARFEAYALVYEFDEALSETREASLPATSTTTIDESTAAGRAAKAAKKRNNIAIANFTSAFLTEELLNLIYRARTADWPKGEAYRVVQGLKKKYEPNDKVSRVELRNMLARISMKSSDDPSVLFGQLKRVENKYANAGLTIDEEELIAVVLSAAPKEYQGVLVSEQRAQGTGLTIDHLSEAMTQLYRQINGGKGDLSDDEKEVALGAFGGMCYRCKQRGHKANDCPNESKRDGHKNGNGRRNGKNLKCNKCGKLGHLARNCWDDPKNAHRRPKNWRGQGEVNNVNVDQGNNNSTTEMLLCGLVDDAHEDTELVLNCFDHLCKTKSEVESYLLKGNVCDNISDTSDMDEFKPLFGKETIETALGQLEFPARQEILRDPNVWIADTGASTHSTAHKQGIIKTRDATGHDAVTVGNGHVESGGLVGNISGHVCDKHGSMLFEATISDVVHVPTNVFNLFSLTKMMEMDWELHGSKRRGLLIEKKNMAIKFDIKIPTPKGAIYAMYFNRSCELANPSVQSALPTPKMSIEKAHRLLGHLNEEETRRTAKALGWELTRGTLKPCDGCTKGKAKQRNVPKVSDHVKSTESNGRIFLDLSKVVDPNETSKSLYKKFWRIMVDEKTGMKFSDFFEAKSGMVEPTLEQFSLWRGAGMPVKIVRCDNGGENKSLQTRGNSSDWKLNLQFEFTARATPQRNHLAELGFAHMANRG